MATGRLTRRKSREPLPTLENGDHLDQPTFHARYEAMPPDVRAELIGGIVYMASPQKNPHGRGQSTVVSWLCVYSAATPGTDTLTGSTHILGPESEPEPDGCLLILPERGGQTWEDEERYLHGAPELVAEISWASESIDLNAKKDDYEIAGVREYVVLALRQRQLFWFVHRRGKFRVLTPGEDGILRSEVFPGLWLDAEALLDNDRPRVLAVLQEGLSSSEHKAFVTKLARR